MRRRRAGPTSGRGVTVTVAIALSALLVMGVSSSQSRSPGGRHAAGATTQSSTQRRPVRPPTELLAFLPHWEIDAGIDRDLRYDLLTTIAFFAVPVRTNGSLDLTARGARIVLGEQARQIVEHAHARGVKVVITFTSFVRKSNERLFANPVAQARFVREAAALVAERGFDGANVDIEGLPGTRFDGYAATVGSLVGAVHANDPAAEISVATNGNSSGARMAALAVAAGADRAVLMGYAYRSAGSPFTGAIDPVLRLDGGLSLTTSLLQYAAAGVPAGRVLLGLPSYGTTWPTVDGSSHAARQPDGAGHGAGTTYVPARPPAAAAGAVPELDALEQAVRLAWYDGTAGTWFQAWMDTPDTLGVKVDLATSQGLPGIAIWALGYERGVDGWWDQIAARYEPRGDAP